jgi:hypothetical protein
MRSLYENSKDHWLCPLPTLLIKAILLIKLTSSLKKEEKKLKGKQFFRASYG